MRLSMIIPALLLAPSVRSTPPLLIQGGMVLDGSGAPARRADVRLRNGRIAAIGHLRARQGERVVHADGMAVAPGFIDTHSHIDGGLLEHPEAETAIRQGITTSVVGQDGGSNFPLSAFFHNLRARRVALNIASFVGHGTVRTAVMGTHYKRPATLAEVRRMQALVRQEMRSGALGLSSGLEYDPGFYATTGELIALAKEAAPFGGLYISHVRDEGDKVFASFNELVRIAREGHLPAQISHIKLDTRPHWGEAGRALRLMADARRRGLDISADVYPYPYWSSTIIVLIPTRNWDDRAAWMKGLAEVGGAGHILLSRYTPDAAWAGKTIAQIAAATGRDAVSVIQEIVKKTHSPGAKGQESVVVQAMTDADVRAFVTAPGIMFCTDGGRTGNHPRLAGSFPRVLARYVREQRALSLPAAIRKMTSLPARRMGFRDRGLLRVGMRADVVVFNPRTVLDTATTANPIAPPRGIPDVIVNGVPVLWDGRLTHARPGMTLLLSHR